MADQLDFERAKLYLMTEKNGASLYQHLAGLLMKIYNEKPKDAPSQLEFFSNIEKQGQFKVPNEAYENSLDQEQPNVSRQQAVNKWVSNMSKRLKKNDENNKTITIDTSKHEIVVNTYMDMKSLQWVGIGLSPDDSYSMYLSLYNLLNITNAKHVRFWGKIFGKTADYYIAETILDFNEEEERNVNAEIGGANKYTYFVCQNIGENWIKLPDVLPEQIVASRKIKRYFIGNLESKVLGHPPFMWKEKEYLRCQIGRISCGCILAPDGIYRIKEGDDQFNIENIPDDEVNKLEIDTLNNLNSWIHLHYDINILGRVKPKKIMNEENEEIDDPESPELIPPLTNIESEEDGWILRTYPHVGNNITPSIITLKSERWPGAYTVYNNNRTTNIYMGYGIKRTKDNYSPEPPLPIMKEYMNPEYKEQKDLTKDPNPPEEEPEPEEEQTEEPEIDEPEEENEEQTQE